MIGISTLFSTITYYSCFIFLMTFAGTPPTRVLSGTSLVMTAPAAATTLLPIVTPGQIVQ